MSYVRAGIQLRKQQSVSSAFNGYASACEASATYLKGCVPDPPRLVRQQ